MVVVFYPCFPAIWSRSGETVDETIAIIDAYSEKMVLGNIPFSGTDTGTKSGRDLSERSTECDQAAKRVKGLFIL